MNKLARIDLRLLAEEKQALNSKAKLAAMSMSRYLIQAGMNAVLKNETTKVTLLKQQNAWLGRICGNIHSLSAFCNRSPNLVAGQILVAQLISIEADLKKIKL